MKILKQILSYFIWTIIALLSSIAYMRIVLGPEPPSAKGIMKLFDWVYGVALIHVGAIIGGIIALLFILIDIFYLKKKLKNKKNSIGVRFLVIIAIASVVGITHFMLEKVIDVI